MRYNCGTRNPKQYMPKTTLNLRVDSDLKKEAEKVIDRLGISMSSAIVLYLNALVREKRIPFDIKAGRNSKRKNPSKKAKNSLKKSVVTENILEGDLPGFDSIKAALSKL